MMTKEETIYVLNQYIKCSKKIGLCNGGCEKCSADYNPKDLGKAIKTAVELLQEK